MTYFKTYRPYMAYLMQSDIDRSGHLQVWAAGQIIYGQSEEAA